VFDRDYLIEIARDCGLKVGRNETPIRILQDLLADKTARKFLSQSADGLYESLEADLKPEILRPLQNTYGTTQPVLQSLVNSAANRALRKRPHADGEQQGDFFTREEVHAVIQMIEQAISNEGMIAARRAHDTRPFDRTIAEMRLRCELQLSNNYRKAAEFLSQETIPLRALGLDYVSEDGFSLTVNEGQIKCEIQKLRMVDRLPFKKKDQGTNLSIIFSPATTDQPSMNVMTLKDVPRAWCDSLIHDLSVELSDLTPAWNLGSKILSHSVRPLGASLAYVEGLKCVETELAIALELVSFDKSLKAGDLHCMFEDGSYETLAPIDQLELAGNLDTESFFSNLKGKVQL
jgi:hypothetical protein